MTVVTSWTATECVLLLSVALQRPAAIDLHVIDGRDGSPVAGAQVEWFTETPSPIYPYAGEWSAAQRNVRPDKGFVVQLAEASELRTESDESGIALIEPLELGTVVVGRSGDLWGMKRLWLTAYEGYEHELELYPTADLLVRVLDSDGRPALDVPVGLIRRSRGVPVLWQRGRTAGNAEGQAILRHALHTISRFELGGVAGRSDDPAWSVGLDLCLVETVETSIDPDQWPDGPVVLELPPTGEVEVLVRSVEGSPCDVDFPIVLAPLTEELRQVMFGKAPMWVNELGEQFPYRSSRVVANNGRALFTRVGLGQDLVALVRRNGASSTTIAPGRGPRKADERVTLEVVLDQNRPSFGGRVLRTAGEPLRSEVLMVELISGPCAEGYDRGKEGRLRTDADGRFQVDFAPDMGAGSERFLVLTYERNRVGALAACVDLRGRWKEGACELGEVVLARPPIVVSGRTMNQFGEPVEKADVGILLHNARVRVHAVSDADGAFALRDAGPYKEVSLHARKPGHALGLGFFVEPGTTGLTIELARVGGLAGSVLLPEDFTSGVDIHVSTLDTKVSLGRNRIGRLSSDGTYSFDGLAPGMYAIVFRLQGAPTVLAERRRIVVREGETAMVGPVDMRGGIRMRSLRVVGPDGELMGPGRFLVRSGGEGSASDLWSAERLDRFEQGLIEFWYAESPMDVSVAVQGMSLGHFKDVSDGDILKLQSAPSLRVIVGGLTGNIPEGHTFRVGLVPRDMPESLLLEEEGFEYLSTPIFTGEEVSLVTPGAGRYAVRWVLEKEGAGRASRFVYESPEQTVQVHNSTQEEVVHLKSPVDPSKLGFEDSK